MALHLTISALMGASRTTIGILVMGSPAQVRQLSMLTQLGNGMEQAMTHLTLA